MRHCRRVVLVATLALAPHAHAEERTTFGGKSIEAWLTQLDSEGAPPRADAAAALGWIGPPATTALPALRKGLADRDPAVRAAAAFAVGKLSDDARSDVPALVRLLEDKDPLVQLAAARSLGRFGPRAEPAIPGLVNLIGHRDRGDEHSVVYFEAADALGRVGKAAVPAIIEALRNNNADQVARISMAQAGAMALRRFDPEGREALPALADLIENFASSTFVAEETIPALASLGAPGIDPLLKLLTAKDNPSGRTAAAVRALGEFPAEATRIVPELVKALKGPDKLQIAAARSLGRLGPAGAPATEALTAIVKKGEARTAPVAAESLAELGDRGARSLLALVAEDEEKIWSAANTGLLRVRSPLAVPALVAGLRDERNPVRQAAALTLGQIGPAARDAVTPLVAILRDPRSDIREAAAAALARIGPPAVASLAKALADLDTEGMRRAVAALESVGPQARDAAPALRRLLEERTSPLALDVCRALLAIDGTQGETVLEPLLAKVHQARGVPDGSERAAAELLGAVGKPAVPGLRRALRSDRPAVISCALQGLRALRAKSDALDALPEVLAVIKGPQPRLRLEALVLLQEMGPGARDGLVVVVRALDDAELGVRLEALRALAALDIAGTTARPRLLEALKDDSVRYVALDALGHARLTGPDVAAALREVLKYNEAPQALDVLSQMGSEGVPVLVQALEMPPLRAQSARLLGSLGPKAKSALPALREAARKSGETELLTALALVSADDAPRVVGKLTDQLPRLDALGALGRLGPRAAAAVPKLIEPLKTDSTPVRLAVARTLGQFGGPARSAVAALAHRMLLDEDEAVRLEAALAIARISPEHLGEPHRIDMDRRGDDLVERLPRPQGGINARIVIQSALEHRDKNRREQAAQGIAALGPAKELLVADLAARARKLEAPVQGEVIELLGALGPEAQSAWPVLRELADAIDPAVRRAARAALVKIEAERATAP